MAFWVGEGPLFEFILLGAIHWHFRVEGSIVWNLGGVFWGVNDILGYFGLCTRFLGTVGGFTRVIKILIAIYWAIWLDGAIYWSDEGVLCMFTGLLGYFGTLGVVGAIYGGFEG